MAQRYEYFRAKAAEAMRNAQRAVSQSDKESWLNLATGWLSLLPRTEATAADRFDDRVKAEGTGQTENKSSN